MRSKWMSSIVWAFHWPLTMLLRYQATSTPINSKLKELILAPAPASIALPETRIRTGYINLNIALTQHHRASKQKTNDNPHTLFQNPNPTRGKKRKNGKENPLNPPLPQGPVAEPP
ncbi:hypothetical protein I7I53_02652 [Histoplasma capsulatum var. duboisii H88]|uniref:Secreted protein n=1 Tax=Ajellomyces capsulatus (strain H88) TaxID=544711 RepID=A0A8A1LSB0_AJEC8|nr:hypothetical protein I7I53_02652 [Histoplasma capsulatum var. duboisii H88]